ncbi:hypothetical protein FDB56_06620 [Clostridium botulinum]|nr:hypothetical protein [Clostridium botulinum]
MSDKNGYTMDKTLTLVLKEYKNNSSIFNTTISVLNIYMQRKDWPICYNEFVDLTKNLLGENVEALYLSFREFKIIKETLSDDTNSDIIVDKKFEKDIDLFFKIIYPIMMEHYDYKENPLSLNKILQLHTVDHNKMLRIIRNDREFIDLLLSKDEIKKLIKTLDELLKE